MLLLAKIFLVVVALYADATVEKTRHTITAPDLITARLMCDSMKRQMEFTYRPPLPILAFGFYCTTEEKE